MSLWAVIPLKPLLQSKSRLAAVLSAEQRAELIRVIFRRTLSVLQQVSAVQHILVISSDPDVWQLAETYHVFTLHEERPSGLNTAVSVAVHHATQQGATSTLILPADLPFLQKEDVWQLIHALSPINNQPPHQMAPGKMVISTDLHQDGTNALLLTSPLGFTFHYGPGSFHHHLRQARQLHLSIHSVHSPRLQFDLDTVEDWRAYQTRQLQSVNGFPGHL